MVSLASAAGVSVINGEGENSSCFCPSPFMTETPAVLAMVSLLCFALVCLSIFSLCIHNVYLFPPVFFIFPNIIALVN